MKAGVETGMMEKRGLVGKGREKEGMETGRGPRESGTGARAGIEACPGSGIIKVAEGSALKIKK